jgi:hypothetical protein
MATVSMIDRIPAAAYGCAPGYERAVAEEAEEALTRF